MYVFEWVRRARLRRLVVLDGLRPLVQMVDYLKYRIKAQSDAIDYDLILSIGVRINNSCR